MFLYQAWGEMVDGAGWVDGPSRDSRSLGSASLDLEGSMDSLVHGLLTVVASLAGEHGL